MPNNNYRRGYVVERLAFKELEELGYFVVRSSGSHTKADLVAIPKYGDKVLLIQLKRVKGKYGNFSQDMKEFSELKFLGASGKENKNIVKFFWIYWDKQKPNHWEKITIE